ncbi:hypothetical protein VSR68_11025 [Paraburkholderia phymatum]|uniref:hypothetical protein n=1 Tax=Paraburkholderia phymatum TaxID=148447 RepID=UPI00316C2225
MFEEIPTAETTRIRLTFKELRTFVLKFREAEAAFHQAVGELEQTRQAIAKAVADLNQDAIWEERFKRLGEEVHSNGYAALAALVDDTQKAQEQRFSKMLLDSLDRVEELIDNLASAVDGKPPLPTMPHDASIGRKFVVALKRTSVRCRRWCIDATAPARIVTVALLLTLVLQHYFAHHATR